MSVWYDQNVDEEGRNRHIFDAPIRLFDRQCGMSLEDMLTAKGIPLENDYREGFITLVYNKYTVAVFDHMPGRMLPLDSQTGRILRLWLDAQPVPKSYAIGFAFHEAYDWHFDGDEFPAKGFARWKRIFRNRCRWGIIRLWPIRAATGALNLIRKLRRAGADY